MGWNSVAQDGEQDSPAAATMHPKERREEGTACVLDVVGKTTILRKQREE